MRILSVLTALAVLPPLTALAVLPPLAAQAAPQALSYEIRKEAEPIGRETVRIDRQGGATKVEVETHTKARVLFLDFHYDHHRREEWRDGKLVAMVADTDDDGTRTHADARNGDGGWTVRVNEDHTVQQPGDSLPLTLWSRAILGRNAMFSVIDAKPYKVGVTSLGSETITIGGQTVPAEHIRVTGDVERDLWYGADGLLLRATFQRSGYPIEMVRTNP